MPVVVRVSSRRAIGRAIPNAFIRQSAGEFGRSSQVYIRGVGQGDYGYFREPRTATYIDDVYYASVFGSVFDLLDVRQIEVLRGPQGTLFGRNAMGGAMRVLSNTPEGGGGGYVEATFGDYDRTDLRGSFDQTLIEDKLYARVSGAGKSRDGYVKVLDYGCTHPGSGVPTNRGGKGCEIGRQGELQYATGRLQLRWIANDDIEIGFDADYLDDKSGMAPGVATYADRTDIEANPANATITLVRYPAGMRHPSQTNRGNSTDVIRPTDNNPPTSNGGKILIATNAPYASPSRQTTGTSPTTANTAAIVFSRFTGLLTEKV